MLDVAEEAWETHNQVEKLILPVQGADRHHRNYDCDGPIVEGYGQLGI